MHARIDAAMRVLEVAVERSGPREGSGSAQGKEDRQARREAQGPAQREEQQQAQR